MSLNLLTNFPPHHIAEQNTATKTPNAEKMNTIDLSKVTKLFPNYNGERDEYLMWKFKAAAVLAACDSDAALLMKDEFPDDRKEGRQQANGRLFLYLTQALNAKALNKLPEEIVDQDGVALMTQLEHAFNRLSVLETRQAYDQYTANTFNPDVEDVRDYINRGNVLRRKMASSEYKVVPTFDEKQHVNQLLARLPAEFKPFVRHLEEDANLTLTAFTTAVQGIQEALKLGNSDRKMQPNDRAYRADEPMRNQEPGNRQSRSRLRKVCHTCGSRNKCPIGRRRCLATCSFCNKKGHSAEYCFTKQAEDRETALKAREAAVAERERNANKGENARLAHENTYNPLLETAWIVKEQDNNEVAAKREVAAAVLEAVVDSGATGNYFNDSSFIKDMKTSDTSVHLADNSTMKICGVGTLAGMEVKYVPGLDQNLLSVSQMADTGVSVTFTSAGAYVHREDPPASATKIADRQGGLYVRKIALPPETLAAAAVEDDVTVTPPGGDGPTVESVSSKAHHYHLWHQRTAHRSVKALGIAVRKGLVTGVPEDLPVQLCDCRVCVHANSKRMPAPIELPERATRILQRVHADFIGPITPASAAGNRYVLSIKDEYSGYAWAYCLKKRSNFQDAFEYWKESAETLAALYHQDITLQSIRTSSLQSDNDGVFTSNKFEAYCRENKIQHRHITPHVHESNGQVERLNGILTDMARASVVASGLELHWDWAFRHAAYVTSRMPSRRLGGATPFQRFTNMVPNLAHLRVFGCRCYVWKIPGVERKRGHKMEPRTEPGIFLGYAHLSKGYVVLTDSGRLITRRSVRFEERPLVEASLGHAVGESKTRPVETKGETEHKSSSRTVRRSTAPRSSLSSMFDRSAEEKITLARGYRQYVLTAAMAADVPIPSTYTRAVKGPNSAEWIAAIESEKQSLAEAGVFRIVDAAEVPRDHAPLTAKWVFDIKQRPNGTVARYKARLVARGFLQVEGRDYRETFSPTVKMSSMRLVLALAAHKDLELDHIDIKCAFLHGDIDCDIYMRPPQGYSVEKGKLFKVVQSLYGLKQASRKFNEKLDGNLKAFGFVQCPGDHCLYVHRDLDLWLLIHVDDIMLARPSSFNRDRLVSFLRHRGLRLGTVSTLSYFVGIQVERNRRKRTIKIYQDRYIQDMLIRFDMVDCNAMRTPMVPTSESFVNSEDLGDEDQKLYREIVGSLLWLALATRPDVQFAVTKLTRFMKNPTKKAYVASKRILRYLKGTLDKGLVYGGQDLKLVAECDASWGNDVDTRRSFAGYFFSINGGAISWRSKLQPTVALSTVEAEYMSYSEVTKEAIWLRKMCSFLGVPCSEPTDVYNDNTGALKLSRNAVHHSRTKHVDIRYHFCREHVDVDVRFKHRPSTRLAADALTKALGPQLFSRHVSTLLAGVS